MKLSQTCIEKLHIVGDLGHGSNCGAGCPNRVFPVDGNGRWDTFDAIHHRTIHALHELPRVGREGLHVSSLSFGVECVECQGGFPGSAYARYRHEPMQWNLHIEIFEIVLARTYDLDGLLVHMPMHPRLPFSGNYHEKGNP